MKIKVGEFTVKYDNNSIKVYNENGKFIHYKRSDGYEEWYEYDENGNKIHSKRSDGYEIWCDYDKHNKCIHYRTSNRYDAWYDLQNNEPSIDVYNYYQDVAVDKLFSRFNIQPKMIEIDIEPQSHCQETPFTTPNDTRNIETSMKALKNLDILKYSYSPMDNNITKIESKLLSTGEIVNTWGEIDKNGNVLSYKNSTGTTGRNSYDDNGNMIFSTNSEGYTEWCEYDDNNRIVTKIYTIND